MKKIVFLFLLMIGLSFTNVGAQDTFEEENYTFTVTAYRNQYGKLAHHIEKIGENPFVLDWDKGEDNVYFEGVKEINGEHVFFGSINSGAEENRVFDGYILLVSESGETIDELSFDCGHDEHVIDVFMMDEIILVQLWSNNEYSRDQLQYFTELRTYDYEYNLIDSVRYSEYYYHTHVKNGYYFFGTNSTTSVGMINSDLEIFYETDSLKIAKDTVYDKEVDIPLINSAILNGTEVFNPIKISYPGIYNLIYNGFNYRFTVDSEINGVEDSGVYDEPVTPTVSEGNSTLNGEQFISGTTISKPGNYILTIVGEGGYKNSKHFTISSSIKGVLNNQTYHEAVNIEFDGEGYLNNVHMTSPIIVSEIGDYTLKIQGENDYYESYFFTVEEEVKDTSFLKFVQTYDIVLFVVVMGAGYFILKKKK